MTHPDDESILVHEAQRGDRDALAALHDRHYQAIFTYFALRLDDTALIEDLTADVFVRMVRKIGTFRTGKKPLLAWLYTIARNRLTDYYREQQKESGHLPLREDLIAAQGSPQRAAEHHLAADCLRRALRFLTEEQRLVILGKFVEDRSNVEMARLLQKTEGSVKSLQHRALAALRRAIEKEGCYEP
ncbi:MAG: sigma-70 family RNA polymerase sigma factor [Anaerolineales bacterium]